MSDASRLATFLPKGGTGKTTTAAHIGVAAADRGLDVCLVDLAPDQNDLATQFGVRETVTETPPEDRVPNISHPLRSDWRGLCDFVGGVEQAIDELTIPTDEGPDLIPSHPSLGNVGDEMADMPIEERVHVFDDFVTEDLGPRYDLVVLDLHGADSNIASNGIVAGRNIVAPVTQGEFERRQVAALQDMLGQIRENTTATPNLELVIANEVRTITTMGRQWRDNLAEQFGEDVVAEPQIPQSQAIQTQQANGETLFAADPSELLSTGQHARAAFVQITDELLARLGVDTPTPAPNTDHLEAQP